MAMTMMGDACACANHAHGFRHVGYEPYFGLWTLQNPHMTAAAILPDVEKQLVLQYGSA